MRQGSQVNVEMRYTQNANTRTQARPPPPASGAGVGLAAGWTEHWDEGNKRPFWFNEITDECTWDRPPGFSLASTQPARYSFCGTLPDTASCSSDGEYLSGGGAGGGESRLTRGIAGNIDQGLDTGLKKLRIDPYKLRPWMREPPAPPTADQTGYIPPPPPKPPWWSPRLWLFTFIGSAFYGVLFVPFIFAILQEAVSEGVAISPFGSEVYVSRGSWIAAFVFLATVSIYTMGVFNMALSAYMYSILLLTIVLLVLLQQARP